MYLEHALFFRFPRMIHFFSYTSSFTPSAKQPQFRIIETPTNTHPNPTPQISPQRSPHSTDAQQRITAYKKNNKTRYFPITAIQQDPRRQPRGKSVRSVGKKKSRTRFPGRHSRARARPRSKGDIIELNSQPSVISRTPAPSASSSGGKLQRQRRWKQKDPRFLLPLCPAAPRSRRRNYISRRRNYCRIAARGSLCGWRGGFVYRWLAS